MSNLTVFNICLTFPRVSVRKVRLVRSLCAGLLGLDTTGYADSTTATADYSAPCSDQAVPLLQLVRLVRRTGDWEGCRDQCNQEEECEIFKFKVRYR